MPSVHRSHATLAKMGSTLASVQEVLAVTNTDSARAARETLDRVEDNAQDRIDLFYEKIGYVPSRPQHTAPA